MAVQRDSLTTPTCRSATPPDLHEQAPAGAASRQPVDGLGHVPDVVEAFRRADTDGTTQAAHSASRLF